METRTGMGSDLDKLAVAGLDGFVRLAVARQDLGVRELGRKSLRERRDLLPLEASVDELLVLKCHRLMSQKIYRRIMKVALSCVIQILSSHKFYMIIFGRVTGGDFA